MRKGCSCPAQPTAKALPTTASLLRLFLHRGACTRAGWWGGDVVEGPPFPMTTEPCPVGQAAAVGQQQELRGSVLRVSVMSQGWCLCSFRPNSCCAVGLLLRADLLTFTTSPPSLDFLAGRVLKYVRLGVFFHSLHFISKVQFLKRVQKPHI